MRTIYVKYTAQTVCNVTQNTNVLPGFQHGSVEIEDEWNNLDTQTENVIKAVEEKYNVSVITISLSLEPYA